MTLSQLVLCCNTRTTLSLNSTILQQSDATLHLQTLRVLLHEFTHSLFSHTLYWVYQYFMEIHSVKIALHLDAGFVFSISACQSPSPPATTFSILVLKMHSKYDYKNTQTCYHHPSSWTSSLRRPKHKNTPLKIYLLFLSQDHKKAKVMVHQKNRGDGLSEKPRWWSIRKTEVMVHQKWLLQSQPIRYTLCTAFQIV